MSSLIGNVMMKGKYNNYLVGGNICNAFAIGELGSTDDFFLIGAEPKDESNYPLLSGNILDSEGKVLFRLVRNMLIINPGHCSKILSDHIGYEIHDSQGNMILKVATRFEKLPKEEEDCFVTTISANFFDKNGNLVFKAQSGKNESIESNIQSGFGFSGISGPASHTTTVFDLIFTMKTPFNIIPNKLIHQFRPVRLKKASN